MLTNNIVSFEQPGPALHRPEVDVDLCLFQTAVPLVQIRRSNRDHFPYCYIKTYPGTPHQKCLSVSARQVLMRGHNTGKCFQ